MSSNNREKRESKRNRQVEESNYSEQSANDSKPKIEFKAANNKPIDALTENQGLHKAALFNDDFVVSIGSAGTGKTYLSACVAAEIYKQQGVKYIILTRPNVEVGRGFGFLPGSLDEKYAPYLEPFKKALIERLGSGKFVCDLKTKIKPTPLQFMRGETFDDSIILLDEAQNTTVEEMKMFVTRPGINSRVFISGDTNQCDLNLRPGQENGLQWLVRLMKKYEAKYEIIEYTMEDNVRSGLSKEFLTYIEAEYA